MHQLTCPNQHIFNPSQGNGTRGVDNDSVTAGGLGAGEAEGQCRGGMEFPLLLGVEKLQPLPFLKPLIPSPSGEDEEEIPCIQVLGPFWPPPAGVPL